MRKALAAGGSPAERAQCRARLGTLLFHEGALLAAEAQFDQALREAPEQPHVLAAAGRFLHARRNYTNAIALLQRSLALATERETMAALVESYSLAGQSERAAEMTDRFLAASHATTAIGPSNPAGSPPKPGLPGGDPLLARFLADRDRDLDLALAEAEAAYAARRTVAITDTLAWCYYKKGRSTDAARLIRRALRWTTSDATLLFHAGMIHAQLGDGVAARRFLYQALNQNPSFDPRSADLAAATLARLGTAGSEPVPPRPVSP